MNKTIVALAITAAAFVSAPVLAAKNAWSLSGIQNDKKQTVAVVLQTIGKGKVGSEQTASSLRFICTGKEQLLAIRWQGTPNAPSVKTSVSLDGREYDPSYRWAVKDKLLHRDYKNSTTLINKMAYANQMTVKFEARGRTWSSTYDLKGLNQNLSKFKQFCKI